MLNSTTPSKRVSFLFTSDEHGYITRQAKLQHEVAKTRQANPEGTLFISCGDVFEGSAENGVLGLDASRAMLEAAGYDVMTVGNHDFDRGAKVTRDWIDRAPCDVLVSNLKDAKTGQLLGHTAPSKIYELNGIKVGLIGVTTQETATILPKAKLEGLSIEDPIAAVQAEVKKFQSLGIQVIGLISHLGLPADRKMVDSVPELDFIMGGHTHDAMETPEQHGKTLIVHPGCFRESIGHLDLEIDTIAGEVSRVDYRLVVGDSQPDEKGAVGRLAQTFRDEVEQAMGATVTTLAKPMSYNPNTLGEDMEFVIGTAMKKASGADIVMFNQKGLRAGLPAGEIKVSDVYNVMPFDNQVVTVDMTANEALKLLDESSRRGDQTSFLLADGAICLTSDMVTHQSKLVFNALRGQVPDDYIPVPENDELQDPYNAPCVVPDDAHLKVATVEFLLEGGLGYFEAGQQQVVGEHGGLREALQEHLSGSFPDSPSIQH